MGDARRSRPAEEVARLEIVSTPAMLPLVDTMTTEVARQAGLDEESLHWLVIATREAVTNAIAHGNGHDETKHVHVAFALQTAAVPEVEVRVRDEGPGFDPAAVPNPLDDANLAKPGGRGLLIMQRMLDECAIHRAPEGGTEVVLRMCAKPRVEG